MLAPINTAVLSRILTEVGIPSGVVNILHGPGRGCGDVLAAHPGVGVWVPHCAAMAATPIQALNARLTHQPGHPLQVYRHAQAHRQTRSPQPAPSRRVMPELLSPGAAWLKTSSGSLMPVGTPGEHYPLAARLS
jgi:hypothetical protein